MTGVMDKIRKPRIAILGDFPIGKVCARYAERKCFYAGWLSNLSDLLQEVDEFDIHWIIVDKMIERKEVLQHGNQTFHLYPGSGLTVGLYTAYIYNRLQVAKCVREIKPDVLHAWGTERFYGLAAKDFKGVSILSVQGILEACNQRAEISPFERKQRWYESRVLRGVDFVTTESEWAKDRVLELAPDADVTLWEYAPEKRFFSLTRTLTEAPACLFAGTHTPVKDVPTAVKAFSCPELSHITLYLAGISPGTIKALPSNVVPLGKLSRQEMEEYLSKVWCLVHPSLADSSPNIVKEARVVGVPAVVTTECGGKQYIENGKSGFIIAPRDARALADAVLRMTESKEIALRMGAYQQERCRCLLSHETMRDGVVKIYHKAINLKKND